MGAVNGLRVERRLRGVAITPEAARREGWRVQVMCGRCMIPRDLRLDPPGRLKSSWTEDFEAIYSRRGFRCRCGGQACGLRVTREGRDQREVLLLLHSRGEYHGA